MPFCPNCGKPYQLGVKFCPECGNAISPNVQTSTPQQSVANPGSPQAPAASAPQEKILGIIPNVKKMKLTGQDTYAVVVTERRMILAQLTGEMLKQAAKEAQEKGKAEGKGFLDRWGDQLKATFAYSQKYWNIPPENTLRETPGNFAIENNDITKIELNEKQTSDNRADNWEIKIQSRQGENKYIFQGNMNDREMLKNVYGDRVKYPALFFEKKVGPGSIKFRLGR